MIFKLKELCCFDINIKHPNFLNNSDDNIQISLVSKRYTNNVSYLILDEEAVYSLISMKRFINENYIL
jgi:hypothetical protein